MGFLLRWAKLMQRATTKFDHGYRYRHSLSNLRIIDKLNDQLFIIFYGETYFIDKIDVLVTTNIKDFFRREKHETHLRC